MANNIKAENDPQILSGIREFLKRLNNSGGKPLETLTPQEVRQVLVDAQNFYRLYPITRSEISCCD
ncbi:hypothetical protein ACMGDK_19595 [Chryseobacterium sp. DT-3]|uniref:hypothetical protein n=1 Tax=Chryseobacterium sp. DT-3 TaxID=3396164 RepID=UPI003F1D09A9